MREQTIILEPFSLLDILECRGEICADCHGYMSVKGHINSEKEEEYIKILMEETWASVKVRDENGGEEILFSGIITEGTIEVENNLKTLTLTIRTGSVLMDINEHMRTFQSSKTSYEAVMSVLMGSYAGRVLLADRYAGKSIGRFLCQYQETDWQFILRLAGCSNTVLYPNYVQTGVKLFFGMPDGENRGEINPTEYYQKQMNTVYGIKSRDIYNIGDSVLFLGRRLYVISRNTEFERGELIHTYELMQNESDSAKKSYNYNLAGVSLKATVTKVKGTEVTVSFLDDENKNASGSRWFSFATVYSSPDGTGWYCMPEIGDLVRIYFPSNNEEKAYALHSMHMASSNSNERINPDYKSFMNKQGKEILLKPDAILITNNSGMSIEISDEEGISIISDKKIVLQSEEAIEITSVTDKIDIVAPQQISLIQGNNQMVLSDKLTMRGGKIRLD